MEEKKTVKFTMPVEIRDDATGALVGRYSAGMIHGLEAKTAEDYIARGYCVEHDATAKPKRRVGVDVDGDGRIDKYFPDK